MFQEATCPPHYWVLEQGSHSVPGQCKRCGTTRVFHPEDSEPAAVYGRGDRPDPIGLMKQSRYPWGVDSYPWPGQRSDGIAR